MGDVICVTSLCQGYTGQMLILFTHYYLLGREGLEAGPGKRNAVIAPLRDGLAHPVLSISFHPILLWKTRGGGLAPLYPAR